MAVVEQENPLVEGLERLPVHPTTLVIFGATGDLAHRKLLPAIYNLAHEGALPERFNLIAVSRSEMENDEYRRLARESIAKYSRRQADEQVLDKLLEQVRYVPGTFDDDSVFESWARSWASSTRRRGFRSTASSTSRPRPPSSRRSSGSSASTGSSRHDDADVRVVIEKPFGTRLAEAQELNRQVLSVLDESQVYRIDHYLGKETVQNVLAFRFANGMFEPIWNRNFIDYVQITASEDLGIGSRAGYYDSAGALRDLVQNHMLQLLSLLCMEPPVTFDADEVRDEKVKVLHAVAPPPPEDVVRAHYTAGMAEGKDAVGYLEEEGVPEGSRTETFVALRLEVDNWRWAGVPIYLRTGKRLARKVTEIAVTLKPVPHLAFEAEGSVGRAAEPADPHGPAERGRVALARARRSPAPGCGSGR